MGTTSTTLSSLSTTITLSQPATTVHQPLLNSSTGRFMIYEQAIHRCVSALFFLDNLGPSLLDNPQSLQTSSPIPIQELANTVPHSSSISAAISNQRSASSILQELHDTLHQDSERNNIGEYFHQPIILCSADISN